MTASGAAAGGASPPAPTVRTALADTEMAM
jgi:hypothetical protein